MCSDCNGAFEDMDPELWAHVQSSVASSLDPGALARLDQFHQEGREIGGALLTTMVEFALATADKDTEGYKDAQARYNFLLASLTRETALAALNAVVESLSVYYLEGIGRSDLTGTGVSLDDMPPLD